MKCRMLLILIAFVQLNGFAQSTTDVQLWVGGSIDFKLNKKWDLSIKEQIRLDENVSSFGSAVNQLAISYKLNDFISFRPAIRYTFKTTRHSLRFSGDMNLKFKKGDFRFKNRLRYQYGSGLDNFNPKTWLRNKFTLEYNLSKLIDPFVSSELFFRLNGKNEFRVWRASLGLNWNLPKRFGLKTFYRFEQEFNTQETMRSHIVGLGVSYKFKKKKRVASN